MSLDLGSKHAAECYREKSFLPKSVLKLWKKSMLPQMHSHLHKATEIMRSQGNMTSSKYIVNFP